MENTARKVKKKKYLFVYLAVPDLRCSVWDLVPWPGIEPGPHAWGVWSLSPWTPREVLGASSRKQCVLHVWSVHEACVPSLALCLGPLASSFQHPGPRFFTRDSDTDALWVASVPGHHSPGETALRVVLIPGALSSIFWVKDYKIVLVMMNTSAQ